MLSIYLTTTIKRLGISTKTNKLFINLQHVHVTDVVLHETHPHLHRCHHGVLLTNGALGHHVVDEVLVVHHHGHLGPDDSHVEGTVVGHHAGALCHTEHMSHEFGVVGVLDHMAHQVLVGVGVGVALAVLVDLFEEGLLAFWEG